MIFITIHSDGLDQLGAYFREMEVRLRDMLPLARALADTMAIENMQARMMGVDKDGIPFKELSPATWERHPNRGPGPPLAPMEASSRIIADFETHVEERSPLDLDVIGQWHSMDDFIIYHITGTRHMPRRDPAGITPSGWAAIADTFDRFMDNLAGL